MFKDLKCYVDKKKIDKQYLKVLIVLSIFVLLPKLIYFNIHVSVNRLIRADSLEMCSQKRVGQTALRKGSLEMCSQKGVGQTVQCMIVGLKCALRIVFA